MQRNLSSIMKWALLLSLFVVTLPLTASAQRRWVVVRPRRQRVMVYQTQPGVVYRQTYTTPNYGQPYYGTRYYSYGYPTPYYGTGYSYSYAQPYYGNPYTYSPTYNYTYREYRPRHRSGRVRFGIYLR